MIIGMQVQDSKVSKTINHMPEKPAHAAIKGIISFHGAFQEFNGQLLFPYLHTPGVFGALVNSLVPGPVHRSEEHTSELQSLMRNSYAVFCLKKKSNIKYKKQ